MHILRNWKCYAGFIALFSHLDQYFYHRVLPYIDCCLDWHTHFNASVSFNTILPLHYALTTPNCSLQAERLLSGLSLFCVTTKNIHRYTIDRSQWLWVLMVEQSPDMPSHAHMLDWLVCPLNVLFSDIRVCLCGNVPPPPDMGSVAFTKSHILLVVFGLKYQKDGFYHTESL